MKWLLVIVVFITNSLVISAQNLNTNDTSFRGQIYKFTEQMPKPGYDIHRYLKEHLKYPDSAYKYGLQGRVILTFIVNEDGNISNCAVERGLSSDCDEEAIRVIRNMPKWKPGQKDGAAVKVWEMLPVSFDLTSVATAEVYDYVPELPALGCNFDKYLADNLYYPDSARENNINGQVFLRFVVNEDGSVGNMMLLSDVKGGCNKEALRLIKNMPPWNPGKINGKPVKVWFNLPVTFDLKNGSGAVNKEMDISAIKSHNEQMPIPPYDIDMYLRNSIHYPDSARENGLTDRVIVRFVINENGSISDCTVKRGVYSILNEEALSVVKRMPPFVPGMQDGKPVKTYFTLPIVFNLERTTICKKPDNYIYSLNFDHPDSWPKAEYDVVKYLAENVKYPTTAKLKNIEGEILVGFVVNKDGIITECENKNHLDRACDSEALRVAESMPAWKPGFLKKKPVNAEALVVIPFYPSEEAKQRAQSKIVYHYVDQMPAAGYDINQYVEVHRKYPDSAKRKGITGRVLVKFIVTETGAIDSVVAIRGIGGGCDEEAIRVIKNMPNWNPGKQNGKPVKVFYTLSIPFSRTLSNEEIVAETKAMKAAIPKRTYDFLKYVADSLHYPDYARINNKEGKVLIKFAVDEDGLISDCTVTEGIGYGCDEEALRLVQNMPPWTPGKKDGKNTRTYFTQSIQFSLDSSNHKGEKRRKNKNENSDE